MSAGLSVPLRGIGAVTPKMIAAGEAVLFSEYGGNFDALQSDPSQFVTHLFLEMAAAMDLDRRPAP